MSDNSATSPTGTKSTVKSSDSSNLLIVHVSVRNSPFSPPPRIRSISPFKLNLVAKNYTKWKHLFQLVYTKFDRLHNLKHEYDLASRDINWRKEDLTIIMWLYATISSELYDVFMSTENIAYTMW